MEKLRIISYDPCYYDKNSYMIVGQWIEDPTDEDLNSLINQKFYFQGIEYQTWCIKHINLFKKDGTVTLLALRLGRN